MSQMNPNSSKKMAELTQHYFLATATLLIFVTTTISHFHLITSSSKLDSKPTGFTLTLIPGDSPESPLYQGNLTRHERVQRLVNVTEAKAAHYTLISSSWSSNYTGLENNIQLPMYRNYFYYTVKVGIGNPVVYDAYLLLDTASSLIWTQCEPCPTCYPMIFGIFDPRHSDTYSMLPCTHPLCSTDQSGYYKCLENQCTYSMEYGVGGEIVPKTQGVASFERFTFSTKEGGSSSIDGMIFGCSHLVQNFQHLMVDKMTSGILGMSLASESLLSQLIERIERKFSYCVPSIFDQITRPIFVSFGTDVPRISKPLENTLFLFPNPHVDFFFLDLRDVSVGKHRLGFPKGSFKASEDESNGFLIDSGAPFTIFSENSNGVNAYLSVMNAFDAYYHQSRGLSKAEDDGFEYCYALPNGFNDFLTLTFHFYPRAEFVVHSRDMHYYNAEKGYFCVALKKNSGGLSLLGLYQQQNKHLVFNLDLNALQFASVTCPY